MSPLRKFVRQINGFATCLAMCGILAQGVLADSITYRQLTRGQDKQSVTVTSTPKVVRLNDQPGQPQDQQQAGAAQESQTHPEYVRLPDGRIVRYGPGIICEENCVEPIAPAAFRGPGPALWWIIPPIVAGGVLCAVLCRPDESNPQPSPTIIIPQPTIQPTATVNPVTPTPPPTTPTPPPPQIPEPGTLLLFGAGLGAMLARRRKAANRRNDQQE